ncbi:MULTISPECIES: acyltransferase [unclassified Sutcliffiella]|uniref:acyltransferase n=1 Tax=unclassified Sutcliffiella TaxID=2837532 RepID=UPI0030D5BDA2
MKKQKSTYIEEIHIIRAVACLLVVLVHVSATYYYQQDGYNNITFFFNQIGRFGTPLFAVISGFLLFYHVRKKGFQLNKFITSRFVKVGSPFLFWSLFYIMLLVFLEGATPLAEGKRIFTVNFLLGNSYVHLYFMSIVFQFYLLFPLLQKIRSKKLWSILLLLSLAMNYFFVEIYSPSANNELIHYALSQRALFLNWIFFFIFDGFAAYHWESIYFYSKKFKLISLVASIFIILLTVYEYKANGSVSSNRPLNFIYIPVLFAAIIGLYDYISKVRIIKNALSFVGQLSMGIYLVHMFIIYAFVNNMPESIWTTLNFPVVFIGILVGSILFVKVIQLLPFDQYLVTVPKATKSSKINNQLAKSA